MTLKCTDITEDQNNSLSDNMDKFFRDEKINKEEFVNVTYLTILDKNVARIIYQDPKGKDKDNKNNKDTDSKLLKLVRERR